MPMQPARNAFVVGIAVFNIRHSLAFFQGVLAMVRDPDGTIIEFVEQT